MIRTGAALVLGLATCACAAPPPEEEEENTPPVARVFFPQIARAQTPASFDASASIDAEDDALEWTLVAGDGSAAAHSADGAFSHVYAAPGTFAFELVVVDAAGASTRVSADVVVVTDDAGCSCALGCLDGASCTPRGCEAFASSEEGDLAVPDDAVDCG